MPRPLLFKRKAKPKKYKDEHAYSFTNSDLITRLLNKNIHNFQRKLDHKAYLHWYSKFGVEEDHLKNALEVNYQILDHYEAALRY